MTKKSAIIILLGVFLLLQPLSAQNWEKSKRLTWNSGISHFPSIVVDSNDYIHVVCHDNTTGNFEIYHKKSTDGGATWASKRLTFNSGHSLARDIAIDANNYIHVVWEDFNKAIAEIYYKRSTNGGANWTTKRLTFNSGPSYYPSIVADSENHLHVVWGDETPGNWEIYYKKGIQ